MFFRSWGALGGGVEKKKERFSINSFAKESQRPNRPRKEANEGGDRSAEKGGIRKVRGRKN